jgi:hypothetical protein
VPLVFVAVVMLYAIGFVLGPLVLALTYLTTVILSAFGGVALLRDAAFKQGYIYMGKIGLLRESDVDRLELMTKKMYEEAEENKMADG